MSGARWPQDPACHGTHSSVSTYCKQTLFNKHFVTQQFTSSTVNTTKRKKEIVRKPGNLYSYSVIKKTKSRYGKLISGITILGTLWTLAMFQNEILKISQKCVQHISAFCCDNVLPNDTLQLTLTNSTYIHLQDLRVLLFGSLWMCFGRF